MTFTKKKPNRILQLITERLPFSIRVLLESAVRNCDDFQVKKQDVEKILDWEKNQALEEAVEVAFKPSRVILQVRINFIYFLYLLNLIIKLFAF